MHKVNKRRHISQPVRDHSTVRRHGIDAAASSVLLGVCPYTNGTVAPSSYGSINAEDVVLADSSSTGSIQVVKADLSGTRTFAPFSNIVVHSIGFAPVGFGAYGGDLFVSNGMTGNLYVVDSSGHASLFTTLQLPAGGVQPGLRQFAWAPSTFDMCGAGAPSFA